MHGQNNHSSELVDWMEKLQSGTTNIKIETAMIFNLACKEDYEGLLKLCATTIARYINESGDEIYQDMLSKANNDLKPQFRHLVENCRNLLEGSIGAETGLMNIPKLDEKFELSQTTAPETNPHIDPVQSDLAQLKRPNLGDVSEVSEYSSDSGRSYNAGQFSSIVQPTFSNIQNNQIQMMTGPRPGPERISQFRAVQTAAADTAFNRSDRQPAMNSLTLNTTPIRRLPHEYLINQQKVVKARPPH